MEDLQSSKLTRKRGTQANLQSASARPYGLISKVHQRRQVQGGNQTLQAQSASQRQYSNMVQQPNVVKTMHNVKFSNQRVLSAVNTMTHDSSNAYGEDTGVKSNFLSRNASTAENNDFRVLKGRNNLNEVNSSFDKQFGSSKHLKAADSAGDQEGRTSKAQRPKSAFVNTRRILRMPRERPMNIIDRSSMSTVSEK